MGRRENSDEVWRVRRTADGSLTLEHAGLGQNCHSLSGAWLEACERYARPCRLRERALAGKLRRLRLLDIGTGLGLNLAAALRAVQGTGCGLQALSLEVDPGVIRKTLELQLAPEDPSAPWWAIVRRALGQALADPQRAAQVDGLPLGEPDSPSRLRLLLGDARRELPRVEESARFDAVFLDAFSPGVDPPLWERPFLEEVARRMAEGAWLSTYTVSMAVRARLRAAGLEVGLGGPLGLKRAGTLAARGAQPPPLEGRQLRKLEARAGRLAAGAE